MLPDANVTHLREITSCEVCGANALTPTLDLGSHPLCDDLVPIGDPRHCREYPIEILFCERCLTAHQRFQVPKRELFPPAYHYRARHTADVINGMRELVESCAVQVGALSDKTVLDIGCNDGSLLSIFAEKGARSFGIEPTDAWRDAATRGNTVINDFFGPEVARMFVTRHGSPDIITFTNVFAHIENLAEVISALEILKHRGTVIVIENHYLGAVLERFQFDTFYHEHPRTYSYKSFAFIANRLEMRIGHVEFPPRYNGNIRVIFAPPGDGCAHVAPKDVREREARFGDRLFAMAQRIGPWRERKRAEIGSAVAKSGKLRAKAFPGRAAIPIKLLGIDVDWVEAAYEKPQSAKLGHYIPGTRIPIASDDTFDIGRNTGPVLNLAWHIADEIRTYMRRRGYEGDFIDVISPRDFE